MVAVVVYRCVATDSSYKTVRIFLTSQTRVIPSEPPAAQRFVLGSAETHVKEGQAETKVEDVMPPLIRWSQYDTHAPSPLALTAEVYGEEKGEEEEAEEEEKEDEDGQGDDCAAAAAGESRTEEERPCKAASGEGGRPVT